MAIETAGYKPGQDVFLAIDVAASELYQDGRYVLTGEGKTLSASELVDYYVQFFERYPIISIEDGLGGKTTGKAGKSSQPGWGPSCSWWAMTCL